MVKVKIYPSAIEPDKKLQKRIGKNVKLLRGKAKLSQEKFAVKLGWSKSIQGRMELGKNKRPDMIRLQEVANFFHKDINWFSTNDPDGDGNESLETAEDPEMEYIAIPKGTSPLIEAIARRVEEHMKKREILQDEPLAVLQTELTRQREENTKLRKELKAHRAGKQK